MFKSLQYRTKELWEGSNLEDNLKTTNWHAIAVKQLESGMTTDATLETSRSPA